MLPLNKEAKAILNAMSCPLCKGQIDISSGHWRSPPMGDFCCSNNSEHYHIIFRYAEKPYAILDEQVIIYEPPFKYLFVQQHDYIDIPHNTTQPFQKQSNVMAIDTDEEGRIFHGVVRQSISFDRIIVDLSLMDRETLLNKIKTILTFR